jgi:hypothetical protein
MKCCNEQSLYVESDSKVHKERPGEFIVMCSKCGWSDKYVFMKKELAESRMTELNGNEIKKIAYGIESFIQQQGNNQSATLVDRELPDSSVKAMLGAENLQFGR